MLCQCVEFRFFTLVYNGHLQVVVTDFEERQHSQDKRQSHENPLDKPEHCRIRNNKILSRSWYSLIVDFKILSSDYQVRIPIPGKRI